MRQFIALKHFCFPIPVSAAAPVTDYPLDDSGNIPVDDSGNKPTSG